ncbi:MAG TPA: S26 family signal peptidase [Xanthobacteraceae bacterium]|nr:S26 family signal peptidase [Xanthobacteraceae bacterium]
MKGRVLTLTAMACATAILTFTIGAKPAPRLVWNASASVPIGSKLSVSDLVVATAPEPLAELLAQGGYLPRGVPLIKRILTLAGHTVCRTGLRIIIDRIDMGAARERDRSGRELPVWQGCRGVANDEVFLMNLGEPASLDGRYFGPLPASSIVGRAEPLWTFEEP